MSDLCVGTSGWIYKHWRGIFYPKGLPEREWLGFYMQHFDTVEINYSFYRLPTEEAFAHWKQAAAPGFRYAVKGSRYITHLKRLIEPAEHLKLFFSRVELLDGAAGPILWQLPPRFALDIPRLEAFLEQLPRAFQHTLEFRHQSWFCDAVFELLERSAVALCIPDRPDLTRVTRMTTDWTYIRFHGGHGEGGNYTLDEINEWAGWITRFREEGFRVWAYFNNDWNGYALENARMLLQRPGCEAPQTT